MQSSEKKLVVASAAASVAAVVSPAAQAGIIYTQDSRVVSNSGIQQIDFNNDANPDAAIEAINSNSSLNLTKSLTGGKPQYVVDPVNSGFVAALPAGETIDGAQTYGAVGENIKTKEVNSPPLVSTSGGVTTGGFTVAAGEKFLGLRLALPDGEHFGWIGFQTTNQDEGSIAGTITGYAYETQIDFPINAGAVPEPTSLSLLALGAVGLVRYRDRSRIR